MKTEFVISFSNHQLSLGKFFAVLLWLLTALVQGSAKFMFCDGKRALRAA